MNLLKNVNLEFLANDDMEMDAERVDDFIFSCRRGSNPNRRVFCRKRLFVLAAFANEIWRNRHPTETDMFTYDGMLFYGQQRITTLDRRNLQIAIYIVEHGGASLSELKQHFFNTNVICERKK